MKEFGVEISASAGLGGGVVLNGFDDLLHRRLHHLQVTYDHESRAVWVEFRYQYRPCFSRGLLDDLSTVQRAVRHLAQTEYRQERGNRMLYQVLASTDSRIFNLGGDLSYFLRLIGAGNREGLRHYAKACIDIQQTHLRHYDVPFTTIALVEGAALGGGFEAALSANVLIAESRARFGFPEISFGLFPGMGALSLLIRKIDPAIARRLVVDQRVYSGDELYEMGVVDVLVRDGHGRNATIDYMRSNISRAGGMHGVQAALDRIQPIKYEELDEIIDIWVNTALNLNEKNRRLMGYFARAQVKRFAAAHKHIDGKDEQSNSPVPDAS